MAEHTSRENSLKRLFVDSLSCAGTQTNVNVFSSSDEKIRPRYELTSPAKPGSITPHTKFKAEVYVLSKEEGGRHTPFVNNYRPQFYFRTTDVTGTITLPEGVEMVMPGDNINMAVALQKPVAMEKGQRFAIREGGRTVGAGRISDIVE